jgi:hypothetical protein
LQSVSDIDTGSSIARIRNPAGEAILHGFLFLAVLSSSVAFVEPSPHDLLMGALAFACLLAGIRFERILAVPLIFLLVWNVSGIMPLMSVLDQPKTVQYTATSIYLAVAALLFACIFAGNTMARLATMRTAYVLTATATAVIGTIGYFRLVPGSEMFALNGRVLGAFKDPNVFGPFLIWPAMFTMERLINRRFSLIDTAVMAALLLGLLLSFSRGAWFHLAVSALVLVVLSILTAPTHIGRLRVIVLAAVAIGTIAALLVMLLSFDVVGGMFKERAQLIQSYDVGSGGRFRLQELALGSVLDFPIGMGPFEFARVHGLQQHNVYLQAFLVYGWVGAIGYFLLLISTIVVGLRNAFVRTPWQPYVITALAAFVGEVAEGVVIDTDHWRHFFLLLGMIWGLAAASRSQMRRAPMKIPPLLAGGTVI